MSHTLGTVHRPLARAGWRGLRALDKLAASLRRRLCGGQRSSGRRALLRGGRRMTLTAGDQRRGDRKRHHALSMAHMHPLGSAAIVTELQRHTEVVLPQHSHGVL